MRYKTNYETRLIDWYKLFMISFATQDFLLDRSELEVAINKWENIVNSILKLITK